MILHISELPPPLSACFVNLSRGKRMKSKRYKAWILLAAHEIFNQWIRGGSAISNPVAVTYRLVRPDKRRRDLGNLDKGLSDILVSCGVLEDDSLIHDLRLIWVESEMPVTIHIKDL